ncbi:MULTISPECIES: flagellar protein FlaG [unclassified Cytobacillus]|uniref:flagellar protein FlaG n=1 Tax=unclassified Cytobacillus TaxID=2675268 RepID=UPI00203B9A51|nr:flagellar protein FlaG [Cytobacillus sp. AMY 15.2]MCM3092531.1 flagellar protein FlaG [Cytobacillus sp. AMY 15.2]
MIDKLSSQHMPLTPRYSNYNEVNNEFTKKESNIFEQSAHKQVESLKEEHLTEVVDSMNEFLQASHTSLKFVLHEELNEYYVTLVDDLTQEVVKEIPTKKMLDMYAAMTEFVGLMVDKKI